MRLIVWNCNMALHDKLHRLRELQPDIAIIPECASPDILRSKAGLATPDEMQWIKGKSDHKGVGVFGFNGYKLEPFQDYEPAINFALPLLVSGPSRFHLLAVWAFNKSNKIRASDPGPLIRALDHYRGFLTSAPSIVAGDFNNHFVFDRPGRASNHANALVAFDRLGMFSAYHHANAVAAGSESHPTLFWMRHQDKPYHIDYCFLSDSWRGTIHRADIGAFEDWASDSDHMPLVVDFQKEETESSAEELPAQFTESAKLEKAIKANLGGMDYGS